MLQIKNHISHHITNTYAAIALGLALSFAPAFYSTASAQTSDMAEMKDIVEEKSSIPGLVLPKEEAEANSALAPASKEPKTDNTNDQGSLSGAFLSSYVAHNQGDLQQALLYLREAYRQAPENNHIGGQVLILELTLGNIPQAITVGRTLEKQENHELIVDLLLAIDQVKQGQSAAAAKQLSQATSSSFEHIWMPLLLAWMESDTVKTPLNINSIAKTDSTQEAIPSFLYYHVGLINDYRGHQDMAMEHYSLATGDIVRAPFRALLAATSLQARTGEGERIQQRLLELKQNRPEIEALLRQELPYLNALHEDVSSKAKPFVSSSQEGVAEVLLTMASMLYTLNISQDIPLYLQMAIHLQPDFPTAQLMLGNYFESLDLYAQAIRQYTRINTSSPLYIRGAIRHALALSRMEKTSEARALAAKLTKTHGDNLDAWMLRADLARIAGKCNEAIDSYTQAITTMSGDYKNHHWPVFFSRGSCYEHLKRYDKAEQDLRQARNLSPKQPEVLNYIGYMWLEQDINVHEGIKLIEQAYALSPNEPHIIDSMGWAFFKTGQLEKAVALLERAAEMMPNDPTINEHLGDSYWHSDRILEARYQWMRAKDFAKDAMLIERLQQKIDKGLTTYSFHSKPITASSANAVEPMMDKRISATPAIDGLQWKLDSADDGESQIDDDAYDSDDDVSDADEAL